jgi:thymidylate synthase
MSSGIFSSGEVASSTFRTIFQRLFYEGLHVKPRDLLSIELENFSYELPPYVRFQSFECRKFNVDYVKHEMLWYIKGDRFDASICDKAKMWGQIINKDGSINSNYGQYVFGTLNQFDNVVKTLRDDKDSRRASIMILNSDHLFSDTKDVPCTYSINFRIRRGFLNMSVHMRSQDAIYGMGNDAPTFSMIHEMMFNTLLKYYPDLQHGTYFHTADSFHVYEKHFSMLSSIVDGNEYIQTECPRISGPDEVEFLRRLNFATIPEKFEFTKWLNGK